MRGYIVRLMISMLGLWVAAQLVPSMEFAGFGSLLLAAFLLGIVNAIVRPIIVLLTLPVTILTLGLFLLVINVAMIQLVAAILDGFSLGGFGAGLMASIIVTITGWVASYFIGPRGRVQVIYVKGRD